jgi:hypothetical protein
MQLVESKNEEPTDIEGQMHFFIANAWSWILDKCGIESLGKLLYASKPQFL